ncbi:hypothetical protein JCGZ_06175 [Jatropha curcas]|uniref:Uncharacterized protein n=1 Tax=Jatropha curcas TaxID=180498 RepID=A0A067KZ43_JATCU|nr:hypothetical protein JCGZ_06175 [Jatropha curcas]
MLQKGETSGTVIQRPFERTIGLERAFNEAWSLLMKATVIVLGIYGVKGVGKTTLLSQIKNKFLSLTNDSYLVFWVAMSRPLNLEKLQEDIWNQTGFCSEQWKCKSFVERRDDIYNVLSKKKFVLFVDDVQETFDFARVGIPLQRMPNGSKITFTSPSKSLCQRMSAHEVIEMRHLLLEESLEFFGKIGEEKIVGTIIPLAELLAQKCCGLPLALVIAARSMSCKRNPLDWYHALDFINKLESAEILKRSPNGDIDVPSVLTFCYHSLVSYSARSCFLYCALFPENFKILKDDLIDYWICEDLLDEHDGKDSIRKLGYEIINILVNAYLLEEENQYVKMHSLVRGMALQIANKGEKERKHFLVEVSAQLIDVPRPWFWKRAQRISLMENSIWNLSEVPQCPDLLTLLLSYNRLTTVGGDFFLFMSALKVLDLSNSDIEELPLSISKLVSLQYLNLSHTSIEQLPYELNMLSKLKYLNLEHIDLLRVIPRQVISSLSSLQILRMFRCGFSLVEEEDNILSDSNIHLDELKHLKHLNVLSITITLASALENLRSSNRLTSCTKALSLECLWGSKSLNISLLADMQHLDTLEIHRIDHLEELNVDFVMDRTETQHSCSLHESGILMKRCFNSLQEVNVGKCLRLRELTWLILAPNLAVLRVTACEEMEEIIGIGQLGRTLHAGESLIPFAKLKVLVLEDLPKLKSIYCNALAFPSINKFKVLRCPLLKKLPLNSSSARGSSVVILGEEHWWKDVEWVDNATKTAFLPRFVRLPC